mmetsp:Transcript_26794/g.86095  ORF Transcript_26794/g.86095 Transcript_26794/m.86095 type:complete len:557 (-) Transcript_26794:77-1747(-)
MAEASSAPAISHRVQRECARARVLASWRSTFRRLWRDTMTVPFAAQGEAFNGFILAELASLAAAAPGDRLDPLLPLGGDGAAGARVLESYAHLQIGPLSKDKAESNLARLVGSYASFLRGRGVDAERLPSDADVLSASVSPGPVQLEDLLDRARMAAREEGTVCASDVRDRVGACCASLLEQGAALASAQRCLPLFGGTSGPPQCGAVSIKASTRQGVVLVSLTKEALPSLVAALGEGSPYAQPHMLGADRLDALRRCHRGGGCFAEDLWLLLQRYASLAGGARRGGQGWQRACPAGFLAALPRIFDAERLVEAFASPLNNAAVLDEAGLARSAARPVRHAYCSAFPDTDAAFGSCGDALAPGTLRRTTFAGGAPVVVQCNPPFEPGCMGHAARLLEDLVWCGATELCEAGDGVGGGGDGGGGDGDGGDGGWQEAHADGSAGACHAQRRRCASVTVVMVHPERSYLKADTAEERATEAEGWARAGWRWLAVESRYRGGTAAGPLADGSAPSVRGRTVVRVLRRERWREEEWAATRTALAQAWEGSRGCRGPSLCRV